MESKIKPFARPCTLTEGGILQLIESEGHFSGQYVKQPTLQIINIRRVPANALTDVYWAVLSDGMNSIEVVISTHLSHLVQSGQLVEHTIIKATTYQYNITDDNIHIVSISEIDILEYNPEEVIGNPVSVSVLDSAHKKDVKDGFSYFNADDDEWGGADEYSDKEEPLTWSLDEPSQFCDWTIEVTRVYQKQSHSRYGREHKGREINRADSKGREINRAESKPLVQHYHVHKAILSVGPRRSEYFAALFKQNYLSEFETNTSQITLEDSAATSFSSILDYIYNDKKVKFTSKNATAIRHLAHYFGVRSLWKCASAYIRGDFSLETAATYLTESILYHDEKLEQASINILAERIEEINRRTLTKLPPSSFERIVSSPKLKCRSKKLSDIVLKYCQTQGGAVDMSLLMKCTRCEVMPSVSRKSALPLLKVAVAEEEKAGVNLSDTNNVLRARCMEACVEEWKETLAKPLLALESQDQNISRILGACSIEHRDLPLSIQVELLEKSLCAAKVELDDVKAELLYREEQVEGLLKQCKTSNTLPLSGS
mmetsp:Transcript_16222/g.29298  ORF Transcript_16222/g.29298 Transcript_16222/m.29298 type:complete len:543 (-) Transcript_16222:72-1700(-)